MGQRKKPTQHISDDCEQALAAFMQWQFGDPYWSKVILRILSSDTPIQMVEEEYLDGYTVQEVLGK